MNNHRSISPEIRGSRPYQLTVNGQVFTVDCHECDPLLTVLREKLHLTGAKRGCDSGECGACTVILGSDAVRSCRTRISDVGDLPITTIEGLKGTGSALHPLQQSFLDSGAVQCGFCTPGMIMAAWALLLQNSDPDREDIRRALKGNLCRCTGYLPIEEAVLDAACKLRLSACALPESHGKPGSPVAPVATVPPLPSGHPGCLPIGGIAKTNGSALFTADWPLPDALIGAVAWSPVSCGTLNSLDLTAALQIPGVIRILTASDIPGLNALGRLQPHRPLLVADRIRFAGDALALVLAENAQSARAAADCIHANITPDTGVYLPQSALGPDIRPIHPEGNIAFKISILKADSENDRKEFSVDDVEYDHTFASGFIEHALLEPEVAIAFYEDETLNVIAPSQNVFFDRLEIMRVLGVPRRDFHRVRVREVNSGAAFGKREDIIAQPLAALGAFLTRRPVKIVFTRRESFLATTKRHPMTFRHITRIGTNDRIRQQQISILADTGAYASWAPNILRKAAVHSTGPYNVPDLAVSGLSVFTNNAFSGAMRGFGAVQAHLAAERSMDRIARTRGIDPITFRKINAFHPGSKTVTGQTLTYITPVAILLDEAVRNLPWNGPARGKQIQNQWATGFGAAASFYGIGYGNGIPDHGQVELIRDPDGTIRILTSAIDYGQGAKTVFTRLASEILRVPHNKIQIISGDTQLTPDSGSTVASRQTYVTGNAVVAACRKLLTALGEKPSLDQPVCVKARYNMESQPLDPANGQGDVYKTFAVSASAARVAVHLPSGRVRLEKVVSVHDSGTVIDPVLAKSQVTGGIMMAAGMILQEKYVVTNGIPQSLDFSSYRIPRITDTPDIDVIFLPTSDPSGPMGAKGLGEPATLAAGPAILNAVCDAVDFDFQHIPLLPDTVLRAIIR